MELQTVFYLVGILFMVVMLVLIVALLAAVLVIKSKVNKVQNAIDYRVNQVKNIGTQAAIILRIFRHFVKH